jgi:L-2,4-diaminobutyrate transaminase
MFGCDKYDMEPDLITVAKGLTSAYMPLSAAIVGEKVYKVMEEGADRVGAFSHGFTYSGHPICVAAANSVLDIVEREDIPGNAGRVGEYLQTSLKEVFGHLPIVGEVRGVGLMAAIEFVADPATKKRFAPELKVGARISKAARDLNLIARAMPHGEILGFAPPLVATRQDVDQMVDIAHRSVQKVIDELAKEGALR